MSGQELRLRSVMRRSRLIQRLQPPVGAANIYSFGGGKPNGGISDRDMALLTRVLSFDYMGAAEFEHGAVRAAIIFLALQPHLATGRHQGVFYIAPPAYEDGVKKLIEQLLEDEYKLGLQEYCGLAKALTRDPSAGGTVGWLEIDNGFMFFIDEAMFENTKKFFGNA